MNRKTKYGWLKKYADEYKEKREQEAEYLRIFEESGLIERVNRIRKIVSRVIPCRLEYTKGDTKFRVTGINDVGFNIYLDRGTNYFVLYFAEYRFTQVSCGNRSDFVSFLPGEVTDDDINEWFQFISGDMNSIRLFRKYTKYIKWCESGWGEKYEMFGPLARKRKLHIF